MAVNADNAGANEFYKRCGFHLAAARLHHGRPMNVYAIELDG